MYSFQGNKFPIGTTYLDMPDRVVQWVAHLTQKPEVQGSISGPAIYFRSSIDSRGAVVSYYGQLWLLMKVCAQSTG